MKHKVLKFNVKYILVIPFLILFMIQYIALFYWTIIFYGIIEQTFLDYIPYGKVAIILFNLTHFLITALMSGIGIFMYTKVKNPLKFWIWYVILTFLLLIITVYGFRGFYL